MSLVTSGVYGSAMDPDLQDIPDGELHRILLQSARRLLPAVEPGRYSAMKTGIRRSVLVWYSA